MAKGPTAGWSRDEMVRRAAAEVEPGALDPDDVHLPGLFVKRIVEVREHKNVIEFRTTRPRLDGAKADE